MGEPIDEEELENELEGLEQEQIDERMLKTGTVPVADEINRLPAAANGERKSATFHALLRLADNITTTVRGKAKVQPEEEDEEAELAKLQAEMAM